MDMGFEKAGFEIVWTNEFDDVFSKLHEAGITSWRKSRGNEVEAEIFNKQSIIEVSADQIIKEAFPDGMPTNFGIIGGPPCQDFSINGKLKGFEGERGKLTIVFFDRIMELKPTFFVMENVTGLTKSNSIKEHFKKIIKRVEKDYFVDYKILNALDFGVPQFRERVFIVGIRKDKLDKEVVNQSLGVCFLDKTLLLAVVSMPGVAVMSRNALVGMVVIGRIADMPVVGSVNGNRNPIVMVVRNNGMRQQRADCQQHN